MRRSGIAHHGFNYQHARAALAGLVNADTVSAYERTLFDGDGGAMIETQAKCRDGIGRGASGDGPHRVGDVLRRVPDGAICQVVAVYESHGHTPAAGPQVYPMMVLLDLLRDQRFNAPSESGSQRAAAE